ncbi:trypsin-like peptidase domain-containing protein [Candidatus Peregrinibacteria bacterium]|nr:trypsin-like peptidase domain-containing protein [Candidatus Peregrinibacteria bacterium]
MKRNILFSSFFICALLSFPNTSAAKATIDFEKMLPTVMITSGDYTKNEGVQFYVSGSATIISPEGLIITNNHVVEKEEDKAFSVFFICITFDPAEKPICEYTASLLARNRDMDVALLQIHKQDIRGKEIPLLKFLPYSPKKELKEGDDIIVHGYPGIGGESITITKGQVSGFEEKNQLRYFKTDTLTSYGNSGGTALSEEGDFVGIPTYGISADATDLGYFLDIHEATSFIEEHMKDPPAYVEAAYAEVRRKLILKNDAEDTRTYTHPYYPKFTVKIPESWEFYKISRYNIVMGSKIDTENYAIDITLKDFPFEVTKEYLQERVFKKFEKNKEQYKNYERVEEVFQGVHAYRISYLYWDQKSMNYIIPYGSSLIFISYEYDLKKEEEALQKYASLFTTFSFLDQPIVQNPVQTLTRKTPAFSLGTAPGWYLHENKDPSDEDFIVEFLRKEDVEADITVFHQKLSESEKKLSQEEFLKHLLEAHKWESNFRLVSKNDNVVLDGLQGVSLTYLYEGEDFGKTRKTSKIYAFDGKDAYIFVYDDLDTKYDENLESFREILLSFQNQNEKVRGTKGNFSIGSLNYVFYDISYHRYEQSISRMKDKGIFEGYEDDTFRPEKKISRGEALKTILLARAIGKQKKGDDAMMKELDQYSEKAFFKFDFFDTRPIQWLRKYVRFAQKNNIIQGMSDTFFHPEASVTLGEACKILLTTNEIPVWDIEKTEFKELVPWYKPYLDKGFEIGIIPEGLYDASYELTRGELAFMVDAILEKN